MSVLTQCTANQDCPPGQECVLGFCVPKNCAADADCGAGSTCVDGVCVNDAGSGPGGLFTGLLGCAYPGDVFGTCYFTNDASIGRYICTAVFAVVVLVTLIVAAYFMWKRMDGGGTAIMSVFIAVFVGIATYMSFQLAAFNVKKDYLYATMAFSVMVATFICLSVAYRGEGSGDSSVWSRGAAGLALFGEFIILIVLIVAPNFAEANGTITSAALITPLIAATVAGTAA